MIKLIATDMDGTLLDGKGELPTRFEETFKALKEKNIIFAPASGRQFANLKRKFEKVADDLLFIAENGALVMYKGKELICYSIEQALVEELVKRARAIEDAYVVVCTKEKAYIEAKCPEFMREFLKYYVAYEEVEDVLKVQEEVIKVTICDLKGAEHHSATHYEDLKDKAKICVAGYYWLDMMNLSVNKGVALKEVEARLGIKPEETMVFGDYLNDYEMLQASENSYAMANAHETLKKVAKYIAPSNEEQGVIQVIWEKVLKTK